MMKPVCLCLSLFTALTALQPAAMAMPPVAHEPAVDPLAPYKTYAGEVLNDVPQAFISASVADVQANQPVPTAPVVVFSGLHGREHCRIESANISFEGNRKSAPLADVVFLVDVRAEGRVVENTANTIRIRAAETAKTEAPVQIARD